MSDIVTIPDKVGPYGRAWRCDLDAFRAAHPARVDTTLASWIVEARWAHPLWHSYNIFLTHLRPTPGLPDATLYRSDATHELVLFALDPQQPREQQLRSSRPAWLTPANFAAQLAEPTDQAAIARVDASVDLVLSGELNPDTDAHMQWCALFGSSMVKSA